MPPKSASKSSSSLSDQSLSRPVTRSQGPLSHSQVVHTQLPTPIDNSDLAARQRAVAKDDEMSGLMENVLRLVNTEKPNGVEKGLWEMITGTLQIMAKVISCITPQVDSTTITITSDFERLSIEAAKKERMQRCVVLRLNARPGYLKFPQTVEGVGNSIRAEDEEIGRVREILRFTGSTVRPLCVWRMSEFLVKVEFPSKAAAQYVVANAHLLQNTPHRGVGIRPSLPKKERDRYNLLRRAQLYLRQVERKETVLYALTLRCKDNIGEVVEPPSIPEDWKPNRREQSSQGVGATATRPPVQFPRPARRTLTSSRSGAEN